MKEKPWEKMPMIENGVVIDHVPTDRGPLVYLIVLPYITNGITANIRTNIPSQKLGDGKEYGKKWVFKIEDDIIDTTLENKIALTGEKEITINRIVNYEVVEKYHPELPEELSSILQCTNPNCVTSHDYHAGQRQRFKLVSEEPVVYECEYCGNQLYQEDIDKLLQKDI